jgi:hypothetical protein
VTRIARLVAVLGLAACVAGPPALAAKPPPTTPCEVGLVRVKAKLRQAEGNNFASTDAKNGGARKHYRAAQMAHDAFDDPTCLSEIAKAEAVLKSPQ